MIIHFKQRAAGDIYHGLYSKEARQIPQNIWRSVQRKLDMLNAAVNLEDLKAPPANRLESLKGDLKGKYSIRVNDQYRLVFEFKDGNASQVEVVDYH